MQNILIVVGLKFILFLSHTKLYPRLRGTIFENACHTVELRMCFIKFLCIECHGDPIVTLFYPHSFNVHKFPDTVHAQFPPITGMFYATER